MKGANTARGRRREKRRGPAKGSRQGAGSIENRCVTVQGRSYFTSTAALYYNALGLNLTAFGDRAIAIGDLYAEWRPVCIKVSMQPYAASSLVNFVLGAVYPESLVTIPTTAEEVCDLPAFAQGNGTFGCPFPKLTLGRSFWNKRPTDWLYTQTTPADAYMETCGQIIMGSVDALASVVNQRILIEWELEFRAMLDPSVSMQRLLSHAREQEEEKKEEFPPLVEGDDDVIVVTRTPAAGKSYAAASTNVIPGAPQRAPVRR